MDREEAIDIIKCLAWHTRPDEEKIEQAIKALSQQPCDDAISRKAAINAMSEETCGCCWDARYILAHLPSVNPQASKEDIHREREQAYMRGYEDASRKYRTEPSEDAISRADAIKALEYDLSIEADGGLDKYRTVIKDLLTAIYNTQKKAIEDLPPVTVQEKTGRWIPVSEKLPEVNQRVLVTSYGRVCYAMMTSVDGNSGYPIFRLQDSLNERVICETTVHSEFTTSRITAWMPLPQPYVPDTNDGKMGESEE